MSPANITTLEEAGALLARVEQEASLATRTHEHQIRFDLKDGAQLFVTWDYCPELTEGFVAEEQIGQGQMPMGLRFNGHFIFLDNPFWLMDMFSDEDLYGTANLGGTHEMEENNA
jgi:hypothetical protein